MRDLPLSGSWIGLRLERSRRIFQPRPDAFDQQTQDLSSSAFLRRLLGRGGVWRALLSPR
eukprot:10946994-Lingulodinium_polyedra.AAC.1